MKGSRRHSSAIIVQVNDVVEVNSPGTTVVVLPDGYIDGLKTYALPCDPHVLVQGGLWSFQYYRPHPHKTANYRPILFFQLFLSLL